MVKAGTKQVIRAEKWVAEYRLGGKRTDATIILWEGMADFYAIQIEGRIRKETRDAGTSQGERCSRE